MHYCASNIICKADRVVTISVFLKSFGCESHLKMVCHTQQTVAKLLLPAVHLFYFDQ